MQGVKDIKETDGNCIHLYTVERPQANDLRRHRMGWRDSTLLDSARQIVFAHLWIEPPRPVHSANSKYQNLHHCATSFHHPKGPLGEESSTILLKASCQIPDIILQLSQRRSWQKTATKHDM